VKHLLLSLTLCLGWVTAAGAVDRTVALAEKPAKLLSDYDLFANLSEQAPAVGVVPYDLITPLFTDYAEKMRFISLPDGETATYQGAGLPDYPVGTILVKTFAYPDAAATASHGLNLIETRLLIHQADGWVALPYVWNDEDTDAVLKRAGKRLTVEWTRPDGTVLPIRYAVPNVNQCKGCHVTGGEFVPIGPKVRNLNHDFDYASGTENQLTYWASAGLLSPLPDDPSNLPRIANWLDEDHASLNERARAYLDMNCAHCHADAGPGKTSGLFLTWEEEDASRLGVFKRPVAAGRGSGGFEFDILPGNPDESILYFRMASTDPGIMMPETGRSLVHEEGLALIREWITRMED